MRTAAVAFLCGVAVVAGSVEPTDIVIARRSYFDVGPPFSYYDLFFLSPWPDGLRVEKVDLAGSPDERIAAPSLTVAVAELPIQINALFQRRNLCAISKKTLTSKPKPCRKCIVFSGAEVMVLFGDGPKPSDKAAIVLDALGRLESALGPGPARQSMFAIDEAAAPNGVESAAMQAVKSGDFDAILRDASDRLSVLYASAHAGLGGRGARVELTESTLQPEVGPLPKYPPLAKHSSRGGNRHTQFLDIRQWRPSWHDGCQCSSLLLESSVNAVKSWRFAPGLTGRCGLVSLSFQINCRVR